MELVTAGQLEPQLAANNSGVYPDKFNFSSPPLF